jgi:catechol 2,3-dioxygenase-like lactoylglutathione lyase family enzyme
MKPLVTFITLGVSDLQRALRFYRDGLGLPTEGIVGTEFEHGAVAFFKMENGLILALWPYESMGHDSHVATGPPPHTSACLAHNVQSREEVDEILRQAEAAGARVTSRPTTRFWGGYSAYFQDPDGHLWEVACAPDSQAGN